MGSVTNIRDSLYNLITGLGTPKDPTTASTYHLSLLNRNDLENAYRSDWIARRIVDAPAEDATREWRAWQASQDQIQVIEDEEKKHDLQRKLRLALIRSRLYGGAALVMGVNQGNSDEELVLENVQEGDLEFVVVLNRYELMAGPRI
jgi:phage-related protein (TIGR01555 family)